MKNFSIYSFKLSPMDSVAEKNCGTDMVLEFGTDLAKSITFDLVDGFETVYCFLEEYKCLKLVDIFTKHDVLIQYKDITQEVLIGSVTINENDHKETYSKLSNDYQLNNLTIDIILDKISSLGINSLSATDKQIISVNSY